METDETVHFSELASFRYKKSLEESINSLVKSPESLARGIISPSLLSSRNGEREEEKDLRTSASQNNQKESSKILIHENEDLYEEMNENEENINRNVDHITSIINF